MCFTFVRQYGMLEVSDEDHLLLSHSNLGFPLQMHQAKPSKQNVSLLFLMSVDIRLCSKVELVLLKSAPPSINWHKIIKTEDFIFC